VPTPRDTANCDSDCTKPLCGDGHPNLMANEQCDDGNGVNGDDCTNACKTGRCGDGIRRTTSALPANIEDCDDPTLPTSCAYNPAQTACTVCNALCKSVTGTAQFCGDGIKQPQEICDGGNRGCGACNSSCTAVTADVATGLILAAAGNAYAAGDHFALFDGSTTVTFELTTTGVITPGRTAIIVVGGGTPDTVAQVATKIAAVIDASALRMSTDVVGGAVVLTDQRATALGNVDIDNHVATSTFAVIGMSGGQGGRCLVGAACKVNLECESNHCNIATSLCIDP
jgi:cysteine-rich repeat protein